MPFYLINDHRFSRQPGVLQAAHREIAEADAKELISKELVRSGWTAPDGEVDPKKFHYHFGCIRSGRPGFAVNDGAESLEFIPSPEEKAAGEQEELRTRCNEANDAFLEAKKRLGKARRRLEMAAENLDKFREKMKEGG